MSNTITSPAGVAAASGGALRFLTGVFGPAAGEWHAFEDDALTIGRRRGCTVRLDDRETSGRHCSLELLPDLGIYRIDDHGSKNGTWLNGRRLDGPAHLASGSVIRVGGSLLVFTELSGRAARIVTRWQAGQSPVQQHVEQVIRAVAPEAVPVLITGPTGAGKERLARAVHDESGRGGDFIALNCATISRALLASELFGHVRGAFTGAAAPRAGLFEAAHRGTLFLDEIGEMPVEQQAALLRVLQEGMVRPVGGNRELPVDVRVVAATHQDLDAAIAAGRFRQDLYARLSLVRVAQPGLIDRREEILSLFRTLVGESLPLTLTAAEALLCHDWPLNIRELQRAATAVRLFAGALEAVDLPFLPVEVQRSARRNAARTPAPAPPTPTRATLERLLEQERGKIAAVARALGRSRQQVYRLLEGFEIDPNRFRG